MSEKNSPTRSHEHEISLDAPPDAVFSAITDATELSRWFPVQAHVDPGVGGSIRYAWPPDFEGMARIQAWDPPRHLRTSWPFHPPGIPEDEWQRVAVDWTLEGRGGATVLRIVHSGFGSGGAWDDEFDGSNRGWLFELRCLEHYLERHRGKDRATIWLRRPTALAAADVWGRMAADAAFAPLLAGPHFVDEAPNEIAGFLPALGDGIFRTGVERSGGDTAHVYITAWGMPQSELVAFGAPLDRALRLAISR